MKTVRKIALVIALIAGITTINAQISIGAGLGYNDFVAGPGVVVKGEIEIMEDIVASPGISYFTGSKLYGQKRNLFSVDVNGQYLIDIMLDELKVYPLAGLNYSSYNTGDFYINDEADGIIGRADKGNSLGLNVGAGGRWYFADQISVFAELKYTVSDRSQVVLVGGILYEL